MESNPVAEASPPAASQSTPEHRHEPAPVEIVNFAFVENHIDVPVGTTVVWTNRDGTRHTVTSGAEDAADGRFESGRLESGATFDLTFDAPGAYPYFCDIHPTMTGIVTVSR